MKRHLISLFLFLGTAANAATESQEKGERNTVWTISLSGKRMGLKSGDGYNLLGSSSEVQLGWGYLSTHWYSNISLDVISGPFQAAHQDSLTLDFSGTGFTTLIGYSAEKGNLRTVKGSYGFTLGISYADIIGRPVSNTGELRDNSKIDKFIMRVTKFSVFPSIFFCWLKPARANGNSPELLKTRLEGYILTLGIGVPLRADYKVNLDRTTVDPDDGSESEATEVVKGGLKGNTIIISFTALLGV